MGQRDKNNRRRVSRPLLVAFLAAILVHGLMLPIIMKEMDGGALPVSRDFKIRYVSSADVPKRQQDSEKKPSVKEEKLPQKGQVVDIAPPQLQKRPSKADYLSEYNSTVEHETKSSITSPLTPNISASPQDGKNEALEGEGRRAPTVQKSGGALAQGKDLPELLDKESTDRVDAGYKGKINNRLGEQGKEGPPNLMPSLRDLGKYAGMPFNDHLEDVEEDAATRLNSLQWRYATFFNRIKERIAREWDPQTPIRRYDPSAVLIGNKQRTTVVEATIDRSGGIVRVKVHQASGVHYLDDEALRALKGSGPFLNPPLALFGEKETFSFNFGFVLGNEGHTGIDLDWRPY